MALGCLKPLQLVCMVCQRPRMAPRIHKLAQQQWCMTSYLCKNVSPTRTNGQILSIQTSLAFLWHCHVYHSLIACAPEYFSPRANSAPALQSTVPKERTRAKTTLTLPMASLFGHSAAPVDCPVLASRPQPCVNYCTSRSRHVSNSSSSCPWNQLQRLLLTADAELPDYSK